MKAGASSSKVVGDGLNGAELQLYAENCLREREHWAELALLQESQLEVRVVASGGEANALVQVTVRTCDVVAKKLRAPEHGGTDSQARTRIYQAVIDSLPVGYQLDGFDARAGLRRGREGEAPRADRDSTSASLQVKGKANAVREELGRLRYEADFSVVEFEGKDYDLRSRPSARWCLRMMVAQRAVAEESALDFETQIHPYVQQHCGGRAAGARLHGYFSGRLAPLRSKLVRAAGRSGRFYLAIE